MSVILATDVNEFLSGSTTLLFTDIEGSTGLLKQLRERYAQVLSDHRRLLRDAFAAGGGAEVDTQGDGFFFVFRAPRDAVLAAVGATRALSSHPWPDSTEVRIRIGIHTGRASLADSRYHGVAVHRAAGICGAAHGGQILVSATTQSLLEDEEEELPFELRDLGSYRFKGFDRPDRVYQVVAEGLESAFPPLKGEAVEKPDDGDHQRQLLAAAGRTAVIAEDEARALGHPWIATEHFLLAVLRDEEAVGARVLNALGVSLSDVRPIVESLSVPPTPVEAQLPLTPRTEKVLELALREALSFGVDVGGEHVLLGVVREPACVGARILQGFGIDEEHVRREVIARSLP